MIHHVFVRTTDGRSSVCMDRQMTPQEALKYFVRAELYYGSKLLLISEERIRTTSRCMGSTDDMEFSGTKEELAELYEIARFHAEARLGSPQFLQLFTQSRDYDFNRNASVFLSELVSAEKPYSASLWHMLARKHALPDPAMRLADVEAAFELIYCEGQAPAHVFDLAGIAHA